MQIVPAVWSDINESVACLAAAFAHDPITRYMLQAGPDYQDRLVQFFSLLMRARVALKMPVVVARGSSGIQGMAMGYSTTRPEWPTELQDEWHRFEQAVNGTADRMAQYEELADKFKPSAPHYYLGAIGVDPAFHGRGVGKQLLTAFCDYSDGDPKSDGVYLETAVESNVGFYERAGFVETGRGQLGDATLWCMYRMQSTKSVLSID